MKFKKYTEEKYSTVIEQVLCGRGLPQNEIDTWLNAGWEQINDWHKLDYIEEAIDKIEEAVSKEQDIIVIVDCDVDGYTSAAIFINYLNRRYPDYTQHHVSWIHHEGKQHGLKDTINQILEKEKTESYLVVCPDAASNDLEEHKIIFDDGGFVCAIDHHLASFRIPESIIVNPQLDDYPNKSITGAGVTWQLCRAYDERFSDKPKANNYLDLCALGDCGDMADYREPEIRAFINLGLSNLNQLRNPLIKNLAIKNEYTLNKRNGLNYLSSAFALVPWLNAVCRSGTMEEKELIFSALLELPHSYVESSKRGEKGLAVPIWQEAITLVERIKRRQTQLQDEAMNLLEEQIQEKNLLDDSILVCTCGQDDIPSSIKGLAANKLQSKYQRPVFVLSEDSEGNYSGSARNYSMSEKQDLKDICAETGYAIYSAGRIGGPFIPFPFISGVLV